MAGRRVRVDGLRLPEIRALSLDQLVVTLQNLEVSRPEVAQALIPGVISRLTTLIELGLGHLSLSRPCLTLSAGELQRLRLALVLDLGLSMVTLVLDEPGAGLESTALARLGQRLRGFCQAGNTVVMVTHRHALTEAADQVLTLGPGAGEHGGRWVSAPSAPPAMARPEHLDHNWVRVVSARAHTLRSVDLSLPDRGLVAVTGPSGSGKSTLLFEVIGASAMAGRPVGCAEITGLERFKTVHVSRHMPMRSPLSALGLLKSIQSLFFAVGSGLSRAAFSFDSPAGRCPACKGSGEERVAMDFMSDLALACAVCEGRRYKAEVLEVRWSGLTIAELLSTPVSELCDLPLPLAMADAIRAMCALGLGHLALARPRHVLSGGERQRLMLAATLATPRAHPGLFLLDEPGAGSHDDDLARLVAVLHTLAERGHLVVVTTHRTMLAAAAHWAIQLGPGGGDAGGRLIAVGQSPHRGRI